MPIKQKIKRIIISVFGKSVYDFIHHCSTFKITHSLDPKNIKYYIIKKLLLNKTKVFYKNKFLLSIRNYGDESRFRADNFFSKNFGEYQTVEWIKGFDKSSNFIDIGANVGIFSLFAAKRNHKVISIEPESLNFALLNLNIFDNKLNKNISAYPLSIDKKSKLSHLNIHKFGWGNAMHSFDAEIIINNKKKEPQFLQGSIGISLDDFIEQLKFIPDYVKIDVDGNELSVLKGSPNLLKSKNIKSILIEIDPENIDTKKEIIDIFKSNFFILDNRISDYTNHIFVKKVSNENLV